jgi:hypothetical protein
MLLAHFAGQTTTLAYIGNPDTAGNKYITFGRASALTDIVNIQGVDAGVGSANIALQASGGNVGIGTTSPGSALEINAAAATSPFIAKINTAEAARIDSSGRLLVGTSTSRSVLGLSPSLQLEAATGYVGPSFTSNANDSSGSYLHFTKSRGTSLGSNTVVANNDNLGTITFNGTDGSAAVEAARISVSVDGTAGADDMPGRLVFSTTADGASSPTERMRIDNAGRLFLNTTSITPSQNALVGSVTTGTLIVSHENGNTGSNFATFYYNSTIIGAIAQASASSVSYNTSSDYRLKENISAVTDGISRLQQLKPSRFNFIADPDKTVDGFLAHEVQDVVPEAITGEKDAVDDDGNPIYQGIDQSKLVPLLTAALQEAVAKIESLEARLTAAGI